jgi:hypothetical protein
MDFSLFNKAVTLQKAKKKAQEPKRFLDSIEKTYDTIIMGSLTGDEKHLSSVIELFDKSLSIENGYIPITLNEMLGV